MAENSQKSIIAYGRRIRKQDAVIHKLREVNAFPADLTFPSVTRLAKYIQRYLKDPAFGWKNPQGPEDFQLSKAMAKELLRRGIARLSQNMFQKSNTVNDAEVQDNTAVPDKAISEPSTMTHSDLSEQSPTPASNGATHVDTSTVEAEVLSDYTGDEAQALEQLHKTSASAAKITESVYTSTTEGEVPSPQEATDPSAKPWVNVDQELLERFRDPNSSTRPWDNVDDELLERFRNFRLSAANVAASESTSIGADVTSPQQATSTSATAETDVNNSFPNLSNASTPTVDIAAHAATATDSTVDNMDDDPLPKRDREPQRPGGGVKVELQLHRKRYSEP